MSLNRALDETLAAAAESPEFAASEAKEVPVKEDGGDTAKPHILLKRQSKDETTGREFPLILPF